MVREKQTYEWRYGNGNFYTRHVFVKYTRDDGSVVYLIDGEETEKDSGNKKFIELCKELARFNRTSKRITEEINDAEYAIEESDGYDEYTWAIDDIYQQRDAEDRNDEIIKTVSAITGFDCFGRCVIQKLKEAKRKGEDVNGTLNHIKGLFKEAV